MRLLEPLPIGSQVAPNRVMFGPHVTNLGDDERRFSSRHTAYYERRARGGCGIVVTEGASVHPSDWPYERAPLAERCGDGWRSITTACHAHGSLVLASIDHAGGQGSSAYSQSALWAPSRVPEVNSREVPKWMEARDIDAVVAGFAAATKTALDAACDGVEINAGQHSLVRQFLSGLTNHRGDEWGEDRTRFARDVIAAVRAAAGDHIVALRLSCDELAPWAGITPEMAPAIAASLVEAGIDLLTVVRGSIFSVEKTRPDFHEPTGFNLDLCRAVAAAVEIPVVLQGSVVDTAMAQSALEPADETPGPAAVEMTRAQIADPDLVAKLRRGEAERVRPCTRCNQVCQVRDARNPVVTCIGEPTTGHETDDPHWEATTIHPRRVVVVGGGVAGLEVARVAALRGHRVTLHERSAELGGLAAIAGPNAPLAHWLAGECERLGVDVRTGAAWTAIDGDDAPDHPDAPVVVQCTGSVPGERTYEVAGDADVIDIAALRRGEVALPETGSVAVFDPIGGPIGVALAEELGSRAFVITQDHIAGNELSRTGDLAPANVRLAQRGVRIERRALLRVVRPEPTGDGLEVEIEDRFSGHRRTIPCAAVVDCGFRLPDASLDGAALQAGDCVAPRTVHEAILEGRRAASAIGRLH